jgi:hypothetical protein
MQYQPQDSLEKRKIQYMSLLGGFPDAFGYTYDQLKERSRSSVDFGQRLNDHVIDQASKINLSGDVLIGILAAGPPIQQMTEQELPASFVRDQLISLTKTYYKREVQAAVQSNAVKNVVVKTAHTIATSSYSFLQATESAVFSVTPLPLRLAKNTLQTIAAPLAVTALASRIPGLDQAVYSATHLGSSFTSTAFSVIGGNAVAYFGHVALSSLPPSVGKAIASELPDLRLLGGLAGQSMAGISAAVSQALVVGAADKLGALIGGAGSAVLIGNTLIWIGRKAVLEVSEKGIKSVLSESKQSLAALAIRSKEIITKSENFIQSIQAKLSGVKTMSQGLDAQQPQSITELQPESVNGPQKPGASTPAPPPLTIPGEEPEPKPIVIEDPKLENVIAKPIQSTQDKAAEAYALSMLNNTFGARGIEIKNAQIDFNGDTVFKLKNHSIDKSDLSQQATDMIQKALADPANLKGEVRISVGGQTLLHVKNGDVIAGHAFVKESVKAEVSTPEKQRYNELSSTIRAKGYEGTRQIAQAALAQGDEIKEVASMLAAHDKDYQKIAETSPPMNEQMLAQAGVQVMKEKQRGQSLAKQAERKQEAAMSA